MSAILERKRKRQDGPSKKPRRFKRQPSYHSSSEDEDAPPALTGGNDVQVRARAAPSEDDVVMLPNLENDTTPIAEPEVVPASELAPGSDDDDEVSGTDQEENIEDMEDDEEDDDDTSSDASSVSATASSTARKTRKRNDPEAFATSISKILSSKLTTSKREDPVLSRSKDASIASKELSEGKLEAKARRKMREDKRSAMEKGREKDVLGLNREDVSTGEVAEKEKALKKTAQRGVVKLFNAVRAAQVKGEAAAREAMGSRKIISWEDLKASQ